MKVQLRWEGFCFRCSLTPITTIEEIKQHVILTFESFPSLIPLTHSPCKEKFVMRLSYEELRSFGEGSIQEPAHNSIIVRNETWVHKKPFWRIEVSQLQIVYTIQLHAKYIGRSSNFYASDIEMNESKFFRYRNVVKVFLTPTV